MGSFKWALFGLALLVFGSAVSGQQSAPRKDAEGTTVAANDTTMGFAGGPLELGMGTNANALLPQPTAPTKSIGKNAGADAIPQAAGDTVGTTKQAGTLQVDFRGCSAGSQGIRCQALITNTEEDHRYCLFRDANMDDRRSRIIDPSGHVFIADKASLGSGNSGNSADACEVLPNGVPVIASLLFANASAGVSRLALVEFRFFMANESLAGAQFHNVTVAPAESGH